MSLLEWAREHDARYVQVSTDEVYGDLEAGGRAVEGDPLSPSSPYSAAKAGGDLQVLALSGPTVSVPRSRVAPTPTARTSTPRSWSRCS